MSVSIARIFQVAALTAFAGTGLMQGGQQARFHLRVAAQWGSVLLAPGDYSLSLPDYTIGERTLRVEGAGKSVYELPVATDFQNNSKNSHIELWQIDGNYFVRELSYGPAGKTYTFSVPKAGHRQQVAQLGFKSRANIDN